MRNYIQEIRNIQSVFFALVTNLACMLIYFRNVSLTLIFMLEFVRLGQACEYHMPTSQVVISLINP